MHIGGLFEFQQQQQQQQVFQNHVANLTHDNVTLKQVQDIVDHAFKQISYFLLRDVRLHALRFTSFFGSLHSILAHLNSKAQIKEQFGKNIDHDIQQEQAKLTRVANVLQQLNKSCS